MHKISEVAVTLERDGQHTPWGIRLVGGSDLDTPLIITKVWNWKRHDRESDHQLCRETDEPIQGEDTKNLIA